MDNAAKALLMAAEILIAILILTLAVYAFVYYSDVAVTYEKSRQEQEIQKFNSQFTKYLGTEEVTIQDIITLVHIAQDYNAKVDEGIKKANGKTNKVEINVGNVPSGDLTIKNDNELIEYVKDNTSETDPTDPSKIVIKKYKCTDAKYNDENRVYKVIFSET
ncbi:MAG: hypothetical protein IJN50_06180 [Clostridia bacterium]|nr:hypothetical protein [Clostridia bacterium]